MHKVQAQLALSQLKTTIEEYINEHPGVTSSAISHALGLESDFQGSQKNYLAWSILGLLVNENRITTPKVGASRHFHPIKK